MASFHFAVAAAAVQVEARPSEGDFKAVVAAAVDASEKLGNVDANVRNEASRLTELAAVLIDAGYPEAARDIVHRAAALFDSGGTGIGPLWRGPIVEDLVRLGEKHAATNLAEQSFPPYLQAIVLGRLGVALAKAHDPDGAREALDKILTLPGTDDRTFLSQSSTAAIAWANVAAALSAEDLTQGSAALAEGVPDGLPKAIVLSQAAAARCTANSDGGRDREQGTRLAKQVADLALLLSRASVPASDKRSATVLAGEALAECEGSDAARSILKDSLNSTSWFDLQIQVIDKLIERGDGTLARSLVPNVDTLTAEQWLAVAKRLERLADQPAAVAAANRAAELSVSERGQQRVVGRQPIDALVELHAYDDALQWASKLGARELKDFQLAVVAHAAKQKDATAVRRFVSLALAHSDGPSFSDAEGAFLISLAKTLAFAGYRPEASQAYAKWRNSWTSAHRETPVGQTIELEAIFDDPASALAKSRGLGPMTVVRRDPVAEAARARLETSAPQDKGMWEKILADPRHASNGSPARMPTERAELVGTIVVDLAKLGNVSLALQADADLDGEPDAALSHLRDQSLAAISAIQGRSGDIRGAIETAHRISDLEEQWQVLLGGVKAAAESR